MLVSIISFIIVLSVLVLVHELGHFVAAKRSGIWVEEFGFGIPPRIIGKKFGETIYSLNLFPFGGFVRLHGESSENQVKKPKRAFINKSKFQRAVIVTAGVFMNFLLGVFIFASVYTFTGIPTYVKETGRVEVLEVQEGSPAMQAGLKKGDIIKSIEGQAIESSGELQSVVDEHKGEQVYVLIDRVGEEQKLSLTPRKEAPEGEGPIGVAISSAKTNYYKGPLWQRPLLGVYYGVKESIFWGAAIVLGLIKLISELFVGKVPQDVAGPVGILAITSQAAQEGFLDVVNLTAILSINLGILNIIPFPALDGGRLLFIVIEAMLGKKVYPKLESVIHAAGMVILILLLLVITAHDIQGLINAGGISGFIDSFLQQ